MGVAGQLLLLSMSVLQLLLLLMLLLILIPTIVVVGFALSGQPEASDLIGIFRLVG
jgi:hypothetical protein